MKINIAWESKKRGGGGGSFVDAFVGAIDLSDHEISNWQDADIVLIPSASVITKELFREMRSANKKIVLRVDNALKDSRNRGAGMSRMKEFAQGVSEVIYQCQWSRDYLSPFLNRDGAIIYNGVDTDIFNPAGPVESFDGDPVYIYSCASKGETKQWEWAWWLYQMIQRNNPDALLIVVGHLPGEVVKWNLNFFMQERYKYLGFIPDRKRMAKILRGSDQMLAVYTNDCYSQTYMEALCCGVELYEPHMSGGTPEMIDLWGKKGIQFFSNDRMMSDYINLFKRVISR